MSTTTEPTLDLAALQAAVSSAAAFRCRRKLQPAGGPGDKIFPPTYAEAVYAVEHRRLPGRSEPVTCVLIDSVQSQANRIEEALQKAIDEGELSLPYVSVDFSTTKLLDPIARVSSFEAPHRLADAILRDSEFEGTAFRASSIGAALDQAAERFATPLLLLSPNSLIFGMWDSTGPKGGLGAKFERAFVSEMVAVDAAGFQENAKDIRRGIRRDPLGIRAAVKLVGTTKNWTVANDPKQKNTLAPSALNHSSVPFDSENAGITCDYVEQTSTLSLIQLRRLRFPSAFGEVSSASVDLAARTLLAAMGLCGATLAFERGADLRSRCVVFPDEPMTWDLLDVPGQPPKRFSLDREAAVTLLKQAVDRVQKAVPAFSPKETRLTPSKSLAQLLYKSQELAVTEADAN